MKKKVKEWGGVLIFYILILISAFLITARFNYLNSIDNPNNSIITTK